MASVCYSSAVATMEKLETAANGRAGKSEIPLENNLNMDDVRAAMHRSMQDVGEQSTPVNKQQLFNGSERKAKTGEEKVQNKKKQESE